MAKDETKKVVRPIEDPLETAVEREQLADIVHRNIDQCSLKILRRIAKLCGARPFWAAPSSPDA